MLVEEFNFPPVIFYLVYLPLLATILFLNKLKEQMTWWITTFVIVSIVLVFIGCLLTLLLISFKGTSLYAANKRAEEENTEDNYKQADSQNEGGE